MNSKKRCISKLINNSIQQLKKIKTYNPNDKQKVLYINQKKYVENEVANTIKIINNYIDKIKVNYDLNDDNLYKIMSRNNIDENILDLENILNLNSLIFDNQILIESSDMLNYIKMMTIYLNKIKTYIKYPSNWIGSSNAIWN